MKDMTNWQRFMTVVSWIVIILLLIASCLALFSLSNNSASFGFLGYLI